MQTVEMLLEKADIAFHRGEYITMEQYCREALALPISEQNKVQALLYLADSLLRRGLWNEALPSAKEVLHLAQIQGSLKEQARAHNLLGIIYRSLGDYILALENAFRAKEIYEYTNSLPGIAAVLVSIGVSFCIQADYSRALECFHEALLYQKHNNDKETQATLLSNMGEVYRLLGKHDIALQYLTEALHIDEELQVQDGIASDLANLGSVYSELGDVETTLSLYQRSLELYQQSDIKYGISLCLSNLGSTYFSLEDYNLSFEYYTKALEIDQQLGFRENVAGTHISLGKIYSLEAFQNHNKQTALHYFDQAIALAEELGLSPLLAEAEEAKMQFYSCQSSWQQALQHAKNAFALQRTLAREKARQQAEHYSYQYNISLLEKEKEVTDNLLRKTLPTSILPLVKSRGTLFVEEYPSVSVLFASITGLAEVIPLISTNTLDAILSHIFSVVDITLATYSAERLASLGDGFFAICGAPDAVENHQYNLAKAALAMQQDIILPEHIKQELPQGTILNIRIGLHCGEAVCGMVGGLEKWQYDAYGDTINTASRMESHGEPDKIHISEDFKNALADFDEFTFVAREPMSIKGKGLMNTYFLQ